MKRLLTGALMFGMGLALMGPSLAFAGTAQTISVTTHAPGTAIYGSSFPVSATASSGLNVDISTTGVGCSISAGIVTMLSGTTNLHS